MKTKKFTVRIDKELCEKAQDVARKRGQNNIEFITSLFTAVINSDKLLCSLNNE